MNLIDEVALGAIAFHVFAGVCTLMLISILLKTKWWRTAMGLNVFVLSVWFVFVMALGLLGTMGMLPDWWRAWARTLIYTSGSCIILWRVIAIWVWNWNFWAWSKTERSS